ncbi:MAG: hypothetical protein Edafosvirus4_4 [Edafosvirus sp.]|uniref:Uncharacterized protein n=1 Tax=Edafosvirus sp. TaxID=2487765 RepID=A0A3G4ZSY9_9VIRU|nr:MAG: hypothetical protein Edafosvirus4_4 [Edafosvirus sp.]
MAQSNYLSVATNESKFYEEKNLDSVIKEAEEKSLLAKQIIINVKKTISDTVIVIEKAQKKVIEITKQIENKKKLDDKQIIKKELYQWLPYLMKCINYAYETKCCIIPINVKTNFNILKNFVMQVHQYYNTILLLDKTFPGCYYYKCDDAKDEDCTWTYDNETCSCGNINTFSFITTNVNWFDLKEFSLYHSKPIGCVDPYGKK